MDKSQIRSEIKKKKRNLTLEEIQLNSRQVALKLYQQQCYRDMSLVYTYVSYNQEIDTKQIISHSLSCGKKVAVPKVIGEEIAFFFIEHMEELKVGYQGILEPPANKRADGEKGLMLLPGLAFDREYNRLGYGGGFYDRYLERYADAVYKIALGYDFQLIQKIETEEYDKKVDCILTPQIVLENKLKIIDG